MPTWSAGQYLKFASERTRAAEELLARVPLAEARAVVDAGCGPGNSTELLVQRFPSAAVSGFDTSAEMLDAARQRLPGLRFIEADVAGWRPPAGTDLVFSNAVMQWVSGHLAILARILGGLEAGGVLAVQIPDNKSELNHVLMRETAMDVGRPDLVDAAEAQRDRVHPAEAYYGRLAPLARSVDIWRTTYLHVLDGHEAVVEWLKGSGLRPYLEPLDSAEQEGFLAAYRARIATAYPLQADGKVLLRFPRLFMVAVRR
ncbi:MAG: trans-aconitate 2-methyltransferase [Bauldia sp.]|nr:trans-aconitate 2-methyltransferase [Bauldia sp.]